MKVEIELSKDEIEAITSHLGRAKEDEERYAQMCARNGHATEAAKADKRAYECQALRVMLITRANRALDQMKGERTKDSGDSAEE